MSDPVAPASSLSLPRRRLLIGGVASVAALGAAAMANRPAHGAALLPSRAPVHDPFTLGVASGDPLPDGFVLWTRLAPDPLQGGGMPPRTVPVEWQVATDHKFRKMAASGTEDAHPGLAHSVHVEVSGLRPGAEYFYRFRVGRDASPVGRTRTAPAPGQRLDHLAFAFTSCQSYASGYFSAHEHMAHEDIDLVVQLGDYIYEGPPRPEMIRLHEGDGEPFTLAQYRNRHAQYKTDPQLQQAHAVVPWAVVFDDHEVDNNWAGDAPENPDVQSRKQFMTRRAAAFQAYYEHMPLRRAALPAGSAMQAYRRLTYGDLATFNLLDTRQYRSDQIQQCAVDERTMSGYCPEALDRKRTMLGDEQEQWLLDGLSDSKTSWNILANQVSFTQRDKDLGTKPRHRELSPDGWDGYVSDRQEILDHVREQGIGNMVVVTGDAHRNSVLNTPPSYRDWDRDVKPVATDFMVTSMTSGSERPVNKTYLPEKENTPHLLYDDQSHGYAVATLTADEWRTDYRAVSTVSQAEADIRTISSWAVENGKPGALKA